MGLVGNFFNFQPHTNTAAESFLGMRSQEAIQAKEDRLKIEGQIEYTSGLLNSTENKDSKLRRPLIG